MVGNPRLAELGFGEEALGHNAMASGFQGQRQWTDHFPNGDFMETMLNTSFDWNGIREAFVCATENDYLNGIAMLFGHQLTARRRYSPTCARSGARVGEEGHREVAHGRARAASSTSSTPAPRLDGTGRESRGGKPGR